MAKVLVCDRCEKTYTTLDRTKRYSPPMKIAMVNADLQDRYLEKNTFDLCPKCAEKIENLMWAADDYKLVKKNKNKED